MDPSHLDLRGRMSLAELHHDRQQNVHRRLVDADRHPAVSQLLQLAYRVFGFIFQPGQSLRVVEQDGACFRETAAF